MRILGIDFGSTGIKAVEVDSAFSRYEIHEYHEFKDEGSLAAFIQGLPKPPDRVAVALKTGTVTFRNFSLPTRDKKAIQAGVGFELDDEIPFAIENSAFDYSVLSQSKQGSQVHVIAMPEKNLTQALETWRAQGADPDLVTTEAWAYRTHLNRVLSPESQAAPVMLVQIGHERTTIYVHWNGAPVLSRELLWGGRDLTTAICQRYNLPWDQAEFVKIDHGFVVPIDKIGEVTAEQAEFSATLMEPLQALVSCLRQVELACKNTIHLNVKHIYLSGGTSLLPGLGKVLESNLRVPTSQLQALTSIAPSGITYSEQADARFLTAVSVALCLVGADRGTSLNLRKGKFAKVSTSKALNFANLKRPLISAGTVMAFFFFSLIVESSVYHSRITSLDDQLERAVRTFFGQISSSAIHTYMADTSGLRKQITQQLTKQRELSKLTEPNPHSPLAFLKETSVAIPKDVVVDMTQFQVGAAPAQSPGTSLTFLVSNPQMAEKLATILGPRIQGMQRTKMDEVPGSDPGSKRWKVTFSGKPSEDSYGK